ncbi:MAG: 3-deoxy-manno-octulosonate cytidylyltransferase [Candidatus Aminicenantes bacterium]|nr:3-deoxy-manno-octulosonate cytidylyltransferase [Candidatus Aminicenantes bacterium]
MKLATGVIPARYQSQRFPGKPLALIQGKPMIQRVYEQAREARFLERLIIATDDEKILKVASGFGAEVQMTSPLHNSGTERVAEVAKQIRTSIVINIQGDEPLLRGEMIDDLVKALQDETIPMATLAAREKDMDLLYDNNVIKVAADREGFALNFSRSPLPLEAPDYFLQHIGIYGFQKEFLLALCKMPPSKSEKEENLEQLRAVDNGYRIKIIETQFSTLSVDSPQDIIRVEKFLDDGAND